MLEERVFFLSLSSVPGLEKILIFLRNHMMPSKFLQDAEAESLIIGLIGVVLWGVLVSSFSFNQWGFYSVIDYFCTQQIECETDQFTLTLLLLFLEQAWLSSDGTSYFPPHFMENIALQYLTRQHFLLIWPALPRHLLLKSLESLVICLTSQNNELWGK